MSFSEEEILGALGKIPSDGFLAESAEVQAKWLHFVTSVDADPKNLHDVMFYAIVARTLAEVMGSAQPADYAEPHMRSLIVDGIKVSSTAPDENFLRRWKALCPTRTASLQKKREFVAAPEKAFPSSIVVLDPGVQPAECHPGRRVPGAAIRPSTACSCGTPWPGPLRTLATGKPSPALTWHPAAGRAPEIR